MRGKAAGRFRPSRQRPDEAPPNRWLMTYADAMTLLLAFFIMMYAYSDIDQHQFSAFLEGLREPFGNIAASGVLDDAPGAVDVDTSIEGGTPGYEEMLEQLSTLDVQRIFDLLAQLPPSAIAGAYDRARAEEQLDEVDRALTAALQQAGLDTHVERRREERGLVVSISSDDVLFDTGSTIINATGLEIIEVVSDTLRRFPNPVLVEGHTDNVPILRDDYTNWNLSTDRAVAVLQQMIERHDVPTNQIAAAGYGEYHPVDTNATPQGRSKNRRVDIVVLVDPEHDRLNPR